jgi:hypothetical protein
MKISELAAQIALGSVFAIFGVNGFVNFLAELPLQGLAGQFLYALSASHTASLLAGFK